MSSVVFLETLRRHVRNGVYIVILCVFGTLALLTGAMGGSSGFWVGIVTLAGVILGCQLIGPEFSSGTLQLVLAKPVNRSVYLLSRYAGVVAAIAIYFAVPLVIDLAARMLIGKQDFASSMVISPANTLISFLMTVALLALFGSFTRSYLNVAIYLLLQTLFYAGLAALQAIEAGDFSISPFFKAHPGIRGGLKTVLKNLYPSASPEFDWRWVAMVVSNAAVMLFLACLIFRRREVPYGAD